MNPLDRIAVTRFRQLVTKGLGLQPDDSQLEDLVKLLDERVRKVGAPDRVAYLDNLVENRGELRALAAVLTTGETYFFRNHEQLEAFVHVAVPERMRARGSERVLRILSAGCSSGEEVYSLAMMLDLHVPELTSWQVEIVGVDVNAQALAKATRARYTTWALRQTSPELTLRFFDRHDDEFRVHDDIARRVRFEERNLLDEQAALWPEGHWDIVFCRNVTMYFPAETTKAIIARFYRSLVEDGFLFLGHAETLRGISHSFHLHHSHDAFYYQRGTGTVQAKAELPVFDGQTWVEVIAAASGRVADLTTSSSAPVPPVPKGLDVAIELLRKERFDEAMLHLESMSAEARRQPAAELVAAVLLTNRGDLDAAESVCRRLLELDELDAEAHYLLALGYNQRGDRAAAVEHGRTAAYLDPTFAMPRLHLGLMAKRAADPETARRELDEALALLDDESETRLLLFGGGFSREGLVRLCVAERQAVGALS